MSLVGWSLGGIYARHLARQHPHLVRQVITLGSPFRLTDPRHSRASEMFDRYSHLHVPPSQLPQDERTAAPLLVPATAVYSRTDGVVAWQTCLDEPGPQRENVEVHGSHIGLGHNPAVAPRRVVATSLGGVRFPCRSDSALPRPPTNESAGG